LISEFDDEQQHAHARCKGEIPDYLMPIASTQLRVDPDLRTAAEVVALAEVA
jgi:hypothetical protein